MALRQIGARLILRGQTGFIQGMNEASGSVTDFEKATGSASTKAVALGTVMGNLATGGIQAVARGIGRVTDAGADFLGGSVEKAAALEAQMSGVAAVLGISGDELDSLKNLATELGLDPNLKVSATEAASAIEVLAKNGVDADKIMEGAAKTTVALANATGADMATAADIATDAMSQFNIGVDDMDKAVDGITGVVNNSKLGVNDYRLAIANAGEIAAGSGLSFEDFNTTVAATASGFSSGADAGTSLKSMIQRLSNPTVAVASSMEQLGLSLFDSNGNMVSMAEFADQLNGALSGMTEEQKAATLAQLGGADASRTLLGLSKFTAESFTELGNSVNKAGQAQESSTERMNNLAGSMDILDGVIETIQLSIGEEFLPVLTTLAKKFTEIAEQVAPKIIAAFATISIFTTTLVNSLTTGEGVIKSFADAMEAVGVEQETIDAFTDFATSVQEVISVVSTFVSEHKDAFIGALTAIGGVLAGAAIATALTGIAGAIAALLTPMGLAIATVALLGAAWNANWFGIRDTVNEVVGVIEPQVNQVITNIRNWWAENGQGIVNKWLEVWTLVSGFFAGITIGIFGIFQAFKLLFRGDFAGFAEGLFTVWKDNWTNIADFVLGMWDLVSPHLATFFTNISAWFTEQDWLGLATTALTGIAEAFDGFWDLISPHLDALFSSAKTWFEEQDWASLTKDTAQTLADGFADLDAKATEFFVDFLDSATTWFEDQDWAGIGEKVGVALADGLKKLFEFVTVTLPGFVENVKLFFENTDWPAMTKAVGEDLIQGVIDGIKAMGLAMLTAISDFATGVIDGFRAAWGATSPSTIFKDIGEDLIQGLIDGVKAMLDNLKTTLRDIAQGGIDEVKKFVDKFKSVGRDLMEGLKEGIMSKVSDIAQAAKDAVSGILDAAKGVLGIESPSKEFFAIGTEITQGLIDGVTEADLGMVGFSIGKETTEGIKGALELDPPLDIGRTIGQQLAQGLIGAMSDAEGGIVEAIGNMLDAASKFTGFGGVFGRTVVDPLREEFERLDDIVTAEERLVMQVFGFESVDEVRAALPELTMRLARGDFAMFQDQERALAALITATNLRGEATRRLREEEEKLLEIQRQQQELAFLKQQLDLIKLIQDEGLDTALLEGLTLGVDANIQDILRVMTEVTQALIDRANQQLQIASPSKVFKKMGEHVMEGLALGIAGGPGPGIALPASATQIANQATNIVNNREIVVNYTNNSGAPLRDQSELDFLLASYA